MIGESGGIGSLVYQEQVSRETQIQRDQSANNETEENNSRQAPADVATFSSAALELSRTAVTAVEESPEVEVDQESQEVSTPVAGDEGSAPPGQYLDVAA